MRLLRILLLFILCSPLWGALPTILFNSSTGSDTAASGSGPGTALSGTAAATAASTLVTLLVDNPDLSGVATDGSAAIWVGSSSGRQFAKITAVDNTVGVKTVTVANAYANTESGKNWGIGGKRSSFDAASNRTLLGATGALAGWTIQFEDSTAATLTTSAISGATSGDATTGPIIIRGATAGIVMNQTGSANHFASTAASNPTFWKFENLKFTNSNGTKTNAIAFNMNTGQFTLNNCSIGDVTNTLATGLGRAGGTPEYYCFNTEISYCSTGGTARGVLIFEGCWIHNNAVGIIQGSTSGMQIFDSLITGNTGDGINFSFAGTSAQIIIRNCTIHGNGGDGVDMSAGVFTVFPFMFNNNFTGNGNYGIRAASGQATLGTFDYNNYGAGGLVNTSGAYLNLNAGEHDLAVDPGYVNAAGNNFATGAAVRALGFPLASVGTIGAGRSSTSSYTDVGAMQQQFLPIGFPRGRFGSQ